MDSDRVFILNAIADAVGVDRAAVETTDRLADIGFDSLTAVSFISAIETNYSLMLDNDHVLELFGATTVEEVAAIVRRLTHTTGEPGADVADAQQLA
jgi:acyl carrier protein